jgi:GNAT superfamily N-acetyltransferase
MTKVTVYYLELIDPMEPHLESSPGIEVRECGVKQYEYNRFLYDLVGKDWQWIEKRTWSDDAWREYAENPDLRTWVAYLGGSPAGYYELLRTAAEQVQIAYFGLNARFTGRGLGRYLLQHAIQSAREWGSHRTWVHTCTLDHPMALSNYLARGFRIYRIEETLLPA